MVTKTEYVFIGEEWLVDVNDPEIDNYPPTNGGLKQFSFDCKESVRRANQDKENARQEIQKIRQATEQTKQK